MNQNLTTFLSQLKEAVLRQEFAEIGQVRRVRVGEVVVQDGAYIRSIPIILSGALKVLQTDGEGRDRLIYYLNEGESCIMSILGALNNETSKVKVVAERDTEIVMIPMQNAAIWVKKYPSWTEYIFKLYQKRFEELLEVVKEVSSKSLAERLTDFLIQKSTLDATRSLLMTHQQIAAELGTSRVVISRLLKDMENDQKIELSRNKIKILKLV